MGWLQPTNGGGGQEGNKRCFNPSPQSSQQAFNPNEFLVGESVLLSTPITGLKVTRPGPAVFPGTIESLNSCNKREREGEFTGIV